MSTEGTCAFYIKFCYFEAAELLCVPSSDFFGLLLNKTLWLLFIQKYSVDVLLCVGAQAGKMLLMVTANDIDIEPRLTYDLLTSAEMFAVDKYSGKLSLTGKLDYETHTSHNLTVMVGSCDLFVVIVR